MGDVTILPTITTAPEPPNQVLEKAKEWGLERVVIVGADENGNLKWGGSFSEVEGILLLLEVVKFEILTDVADGNIP